jgi:hypothetical protein
VAVLLSVHKRERLEETVLCLLAGVYSSCREAVSSILLSVGDEGHLSGWFLTRQGEGQRESLTKFKCVC